MVGQTQTVRLRFEFAKPKDVGCITITALSQMCHSTFAMHILHTHSMFDLKHILHTHSMFDHTFNVCTSTQCLISSTHTQCLISSTSCTHTHTQCLISSTSCTHTQCLINTSCTHIQCLISSTFVMHSLPTHSMFDLKHSSHTNTHSIHSF